MTFTVELTRSARRAIELELPEAAAVACWEFMRGPLAANPFRVGKPLRDRLAGLYSARRGEFRVVYRILEDRVVVQVINVDHRRDVHR